MNFRPLFDLRLKHPYYRDDRCPDFEIEPDPETAREMGKLRAKFKIMPDGGQLILPVESGDKPLISLTPGTVFRFRLRLKNPNFMVFSDLSGFSASALPIFSNGESTSTENTQLGRTFISRATPVNYFARVDIHINASLPGLGPTPRRFEATFEANRLRWQYYFVTDLKHDAAQFRIRDTDAGTPIVFQSHGGEDTVSKMLKAQYPDLLHLRFVSEQPVPCRQSPGKSIQLFLGPDRLVDSLPNPSLRHFGVLATAPGGNGEPPNSLFHIVKYISHSQITNGT